MRTKTAKLPEPVPQRHSTAPIANFLERHALAGAVLLTLLASARIVATYPVFNHTFDEPVHIACGMEWLDKGSYTYEPQHPPLARIATAIGPYLLGAHSQHPATANPAAMMDEGVRILYSGNHYDLSLFLARLGCLPFFWIAALVTYEWARQYYGRAVGALAICAFTFIPTVLAHAGLATTDMALMAFLGAAFLAGIRWLEQPTLARAAVFGVCGSLAVLSKFSSLVFFPAAAGLALLCYFLLQRPSAAEVLARIRRMLPGAGLAAVISFFMVWALYRFSVGPVPSLGNLKLPFPELFAGIQQVRVHNDEGHFSFLLGQRGRMGWWYFFPVALAVKTPLGFLLLLFAGLYLIARGRIPVPRAWVPAAFAIAILLVGMTSRINIGLRHILPVYMGFSIVVALAAHYILQHRGEQRGALIALGVLAAWFAGSSLLAHPDYLPYFNELAGSHPENILVDSDLDWGQDVKRLARRMREVGARELTFSTAFRIDYAKAGLPPRRENMDVLNPPPGWTAISVSTWKEYRLGLMDRYEQYTIWPDRIPPTEKVGKGIFLWYTPPSETRGAR